MDNGSDDDSCDYVRERFPWVRIFEMGYNAGFAKANNRAVERSRGDLIAFLNNDVEVAPDWLGKLVTAAGTATDTVAWASKMMIFDHRHLINGVGGVMNEVGYTFDRGMYERDYGQYDRPAAVLFPCAGACLIRRDAFLSAGGFDEAFFMYHEDVDLGWSLWLRGGRVETVPSAVVFHKFGGTSKATMGMARREHIGERNSIRSLIKHYEWPNLIRAILKLVRHPQSPARKLQLVRNLRWNIFRMPGTLKLRWDIQRSRRLRDQDIAHLIFPGTRIPLTLPDYELATPDSFLATGRTVFQVTMGENEIGCLSYGWHHVEPNPAGDGRSVRWTQKEACVMLSADGRHSRLCMRLYAMSDSTGVAAEGECFINGQSSGRFSAPHEGWNEVCVALPRESAPSYEVRIRMDSTWTPAGVFRNDDPRTLGVGVQRVWLQ